MSVGQLHYKILLNDSLGTAENMKYHSKYKIVDNKKNGRYVKCVRFNIRALRKNEYNKTILHHRDGMYL